jgi:hypothetical protein
MLGGSTAGASRTVISISKTVDAPIWFKGASAARRKFDGDLLANIPLYVTRAAKSRLFGACRIM